MPAASTKPKPKPPRPPRTDAERQFLERHARLSAAEASLHEFVRQAWQVIEPALRFVDNWHLAAICDHLEAVTDGRICNLLVNEPPGTMKSLLVCVFWPAWVWARQPAKRFMFSSYSESLSLRDSMLTRKVLASQWYQERWPLGFSESQDAKGKFENERGGWRMVGSVGGKGTGEHPDFNVGDDIHNVLQAESDMERAAVTRWLEGVFCTRGVVRDVRRVVIGQRLHAQDGFGLLLSKGGWTHICLPMRYEPGRMPATPLGWNDPRRTDGELLWPALFPEEKVANLEALMGLYGSAGQLQQRPSPRGGGKFKREWFELLGALPPCHRFVRYWDKAGSRDGTGARTSGVLMGEWTDPGAALPTMRTKYVVVDVVNVRKEAAEREAVIKQTAQTDKASYGYVTTWVEQEPGSGGKESAQATVGNLAGFTCNYERVTGSKEVRADPLSSQASVGKVKLLAGSWNTGFLDELENFPLGRLKDQVDAASGAFNKLNEGGGGFGSGDGFYTGGGSDLAVPGQSPVESTRLGSGDF